MKALLAKKHKPLLDLWKNKKYNQLQKPMTFKYPVVKNSAPTLKTCSGWEGKVIYLEDRARDRITAQSTKTQMINNSYWVFFLKYYWFLIFHSNHIKHVLDISSLNNFKINITYYHFWPYLEISRNVCFALLLVKLLDIMYSSAYIICSNY